MPFRSRVAVLILRASAILLAPACGANDATPAGAAADGAGSVDGSVAAQVAPQPRADAAAFSGTRLDASRRVIFDLYGAPVGKRTFTNDGVKRMPAITLDDLNATLSEATDGNAVTVLRGPARSIVPYGLNANDTNLRLPREGNQIYAINANVRLKIGSSLDVNYTLTADDIDPVDGRLYVHAVGVPVLHTGPNHVVEQQAYAFVHLSNTSRQIVDVQSKTAWAEQPGIPWQRANGYQWTDWRLVELAPSVRKVSVGDTVQLHVVAAGCSLGGHYGAIYLDTVGSYRAGGTTLSAYGPNVVVQGGNARFNFRLRHHGDETANHAVVRIMPPQGSTVRSWQAPSDWNCTTPQLASNDNIICQIEALPSGYVGEATLDLRVNSTAAGTLVLALFGVQTDDQLQLLGPTLVARIVADGAAHADLQVKATEDASQATKDTATLEVVLRNAGPAGVQGVQLVDAPAPHLTVQSWQCSFTGNAALSGSAFGAGTGRLNTVVDLPAGDAAICTVVVARDGSGILDTYGVASLSPNGVVDPVSSNNEGACLVRGTYVAPPLPATPNAVVAPAPDPAPVAGAQGANCSTDGDCINGTCSDGFCSQQRCSGVCEAANVAGHEGICTPLDGVGPLASHGSCGPYTCAAGTCRSSCSADDHCLVGLTCQDAVCRPKPDACRQDADCPTGRSCTPAHTCDAVAVQDANHPNWTLEGSGCSAGNGSGALPAAMALLGGLGRRRFRHLRRSCRRPSGWRTLAAWPRRRGARGRTGGTTWPALLLGLLAGAAGFPPRALAADSSSLPTATFQPLGGLHDVYGVASAPIDATGSSNLQLWLNYAHAPLRLRHTVPPRVSQPIVANQGSLDIAGGVALPWRLELDVAVPLILQWTRRAPFASTALTHQHAQFSLGDLRLMPKWTVVAGNRARLALGAVLTLPTGRRNAFVGRGSSGIAPLLIGDFGAPRSLRVVLNVGADVQARRTFAGIDDAHALRWSVAAQLPFALGKEVLALRAATYGHLNFRQPSAVSTPIDVLAGLNLTLPGQLAVDVAGGAGLSRGYGAPKWRILVGFAWHPERQATQRLPLAASPPLPAPADGGAALLGAVPLPPDADTDGDGVRNADDACPTVPGEPLATPPGCPAPAAAQAFADRQMLVYFERGQAHLQRVDKVALEQLRQILAALAEVRLEVLGHTDDGGDTLTNERLALARAEAARAWLVRHGIDRGRIDVRSAGRRQDRERRRTTAAQVHNRRVGFRLLLAPALPTDAASPPVSGETPTGKTVTGETLSEETVTGDERSSRADESAPQ